MKSFKLPQSTPDGGRTQPLSEDAVNNLFNSSCLLPLPLPSMDKISSAALATKSFHSSAIFADGNNASNDGATAGFGQTTTLPTDQLVKIVSGINTALTVEPFSREHVKSVMFSPEGCTWTALVGDKDNVPTDDFAGEDYSATEWYWMQVIVTESDGEAGVGKEGQECSKKGKYVVEMVLMAPQVRRVSGTERLKMEKVFTTVSYSVKKAVVKSDFPVFPEGNSGKTFREVYQLNAEIKAGAFAKVMQGTHRATGRKVAAKCVFRDKLSPQDDAAIFDEVAIMASLHHDHICELIDFFEEPDWYIIILEVITGGDLFDRIGAKKSYSESDARDLSRILLESIAFIHENGIAHCDLKPKNLVLVSPDEDSDVKVIDFGFASRVFAPKSLTRQCGTPLFVAPEVLKKEPYDQSSDMWSVGVIIYLLLGGTLPFLAANLKGLFQKIVAGKVEFSDKYWGNVSRDAKFFIKQLLVVDPDKRLSAKEALRCSWMKHVEKRSIMMNDLSASQRELKLFNAKMKLRAAMFAIDWVTTSFGTTKRRSNEAVDAERLKQEAETINEGVEDNQDES